MSHPNTKIIRATDEEYERIFGNLLPTREQCEKWMTANHYVILADSASSADVESDGDQKIVMGSS